MFNSSMSIAIWSPQQLSEVIFSPWLGGIVDYIPQSETKNLASEDAPEGRNLLNSPRLNSQENLSIDFSQIYLDGQNL
jgi:hypothetical protein